MTISECADSNYGQQDFSLLEKATKEISELSRLEDLRSIEEGMNVVGSMRRLADDTSARIRDCVRQLVQCPREKAVDPGDKYVETLLWVEKVLQVVMTGLHGHRIGSTEPLRSEYNHAIEAIEQMYLACVDLRWTMMEHDAALEEPIEGRFSSGSELVDAILKS